MYHTTVSQSVKRATRRRLEKKEENASPSIVIVTRAMRAVTTRASVRRARASSVRTFSARWCRVSRASSVSSAPTTSDGVDAAVVRLLDAVGASARVRCGANADGVRGLMATTDIARGERVMAVAVPERALVDDPSESKTWARQLARRVVETRRRYGSETPGDGAMEDDARDIFMQAYAKTLPPFGAPAIGLANDPKCVEIIAARLDDDECRREATTFAEQIETSFQKEKALDDALSEDEWRWAVSLVHSRTFRIENERDARPPRRAMVPAADLINHTSAPNEVNADWSLEDGEFTVRTTRDVKEGEELLFSYGDQSDRHFALFYGFIPRRNDFNRVKLFENGRVALDWYQALCGVAPDDEVWHREKERVVKLVCEKYGTYAKDPQTGLRRRIVQDLVLGDNGFVSDSMLLLFEEMCGDEEMAIAAVRERAKEMYTNMVAATEEIDAALAPLDEYSRELIQTYRRRRVGILAQVV